MSRLCLALLGPIQITLDDEPVTRITSPRILALLAYLGAEQDRTHPRDALAELLWPGQPTGRQNLRQALSRLRKALPQPAGDPPFLLASRQEIRLNPDADQQVDVDIFIRDLNRVRAHDHPSLLGCDACIVRLEAAMVAYRGDFLAGLDAGSPAFDEWTRMQRTWLRREALWALDALTRHALEQADAPRALAFAQRQLALDPLREEAHCQLMTALVLQGRRSEALTHYEQLVDLLRRELDVAPGSATAAICAELRRERPASARPPQPPRRPAVAEQSHNLPSQFTPFIGRADLLDAIRERLERDECRLLTLVGPGGAGKTRLAIEAARQRLEHHSDSVCFVDLSGLASAEQLPVAIVGALGLVLPPHACTDEQRRAALVRMVRDRDLLLALDNYEQLLPYTGLITELLHGAPRLRLLVTSRAPLHLRAEWLIDVGGLPCPPEDATDDQLRPDACPALALFQQTAVRVKHDFRLTGDDWRAAAHICRLVQGSPLALELAAARVRETPLPAMVKAIQADLDFLSTQMADVPPRHRSLRAAIDHSWRLLTPEQQAVFARLAIFHGGFTPDAARPIAGAADAILDDLARRSLLLRLDAGRYSLHESLRQFAGEQMARFPSARDEVRRCHALYYLDLLAGQEARLLSQEATAAQAIIRPDFDNVRAAWAWAVSQADVRLMGRALTALYRYANAAGLVHEGLQVLEEALAAIRATEPSPATKLFRARLLAKQARFLNLQGQYGQAADAARAATESLAPFMDAPSAAVQRSTPRAIAAEAWLQRGRAALHQGRYDEAAGHLEEALGEARAAGDAHVEAEVHLNLGTIANFRNEFSLATAHNREALRLARAGGDRYSEGIALNNLGAVAEFQGEYDRAAAYFEEALAVFDQVGYRRGSANALSNLGAIAAWRGQLALAPERHQEALHATRALGDRDGEAWALMALGAVYTHQGRLDEARDHLQAALDLNRVDGTRSLESWVLNHLAQVALEEDALDEAEALAVQAKTLAGELEDELTVAVALVVEGEVAVRRGAFDRAEEAYARALAINRESAHEADQLRTLTAMARLALARGDAARAQVIAEKALTLGAASSVALDRAQALAALGRALAEGGDQDQGRAILEEALALHREMGQDHLANEVQAELAAIVCR